jgi:hypothetical protein
MGDWLDEINRPFNFTNIQGYPHDILEKAIEKLPSFQGNNVCWQLIIGKSSKP